MFPSHPSLRPFAPVNLRNPVNVRHPQNSGRVAWWLALPGWYGGRQWFDLMGRCPGTLTSMGNANNGWQPTTRPGGLGQLRFDGTAGYVIASPVPAVVGDYTVRLWYNATDTTRRSLISHDSNANNGWRVQTAWSSGSSVTLTLGGVAEYTFGTLASTSGIWTYLLIAVSGTTATGYLASGGAIASQTRTIGTLVGTPSQVTIGQTAAGGSLASGAIDDVSIWSRTLSAAEAWQDYNLSRRGYPEVLNRAPLTAQSLMPPPVAGAGIGQIAAFPGLGLLV